MAAFLDKPAIERLSVDERLRLLNLIWETLVESGMPPGPDLAEIERRAEEARANPDDGMSLEEFRERLRSHRA